MKWLGVSYSRISTCTHGAFLGRSTTSHIVSNKMGHQKACKKRYPLIISGIVLIKVGKSSLASSSGRWRCSISPQPPDGNQAAWQGVHHSTNNLQLYQYLRHLKSRSHSASLLFRKSGCQPVWKEDFTPYLVEFHVINHVIQNHFYKSAEIVLIYGRVHCMNKYDVVIGYYA